MNRSPKKKGKVPNWKLNDLNYTQSHVSTKKSDFNQRKRNLKVGLVNHIVINMVNEAIDEENPKKSKAKYEEKSKQSKKDCDHAKYHKYIPFSWNKYIHDEIQKRLKLGNNNIIEKVKDEKQKPSIKIIILKVVHKNKLFRIKVHSNILISLLKQYLKNYFDIPNETIELYYNNEEILDIKTLSSYNINKNNNLEVKGWIQKLLRVNIKMKNLKGKVC